MPIFFLIFKFSPYSKQVKYTLDFVEWYYLLVLYETIGSKLMKSE